MADVCAVGVLLYFMFYLYNITLIISFTSHIDVYTVRTKCSVIKHDRSKRPEKLY